MDSDPAHFSLMVALPHPKNMKAFADHHLMFKDGTYIVTVKKTLIKFSQLAHFRDQMGSTDALETTWMGELVDWSIGSWFLSQETHQVSNPGYPVMGDTTNNVLLVKIEGLVWYTIYHHLLVVKGVNKALY